MRNCDIFSCSFNSEKSNEMAAIDLYSHHDGILISVHVEFELVVAAAFRHLRHG